MYVCMYVYIHIYIYICIYVCVCVCVCVCICVCVCVYTHTHLGRYCECAKDEGVLSEINVPLLAQEVGEVVDRRQMRQGAFLQRRL